MAEATTSSSSDHVKKESEEVRKEISRVHGYVKRTGGQLYENQLAALLFIRCLNEGHPFKIATNMLAAREFDDIVIGLVDQLPILIQVKFHSDKRKPVYNYQFTQLNGYFPLLKYCETYFSLKKHRGHDLGRCGVFEKCIFVLYTNASVAWLRQPKKKEKEKNKIRGQDADIQGPHKWQSLLNTGGTFCPILRETHPELYETFENVLEYRRVLKERNNSDQLLNAVKALVNRHAEELPSKEKLDILEAQLVKLKGVDCYKEFLARLWIFDGQGSVQELNSLIEQDVKKLLSTSSSKIITNALLESVQRCGIMTVPSSMWIAEF